MKREKRTSLIGNAGRNTAEYPLVECLGFLAENHRLFATKVGSELLAASIVAASISGAMRSATSIVYVFKDKTQHDEPWPAPTLSDLMKDPSALEDEDFDLGVRDSNKHTFLLQVTRIMPQDIGPGSKDFFSVLASKLTHKPLKDKVQLVLLSLDHLEINELEVRQFLQGKDVPYPGIFVVGSISEDNSVFHSAMIFPDFVCSPPISLHQ
jgi:hypothetical protein